MTWTSIDDGLNQNPQTRPGAVSNAALGLWVRLCAYTASQLRYPMFDGAFDLTTVRGHKGTTKQLAELETAGMVEQAVTGAGRWVVVEAPTLMKFTGGADLKAKRAAAGRAGGLASGRSRRSKRETDGGSKPQATVRSKPEATSGSKPETSVPSTTQANTRSNDEANASSKTEANASKQTEAPGPYHSIPNQPPHIPSTPRTDPGPDHTGPEPGRGPAETKPSRATPAHDPAGTAVSVRAVEAQALADPFLTAWNLYPRHSGSMPQAETAWTRITSQQPDIAPRLLGAVIAYAKTVKNGEHDARYVPSMSKWLANGTYTEWLPDKPKPGTEWGGITRQWLHQHAISHVPEGTWTDSIEQTFWAQVKAGETPETVAERLVSEINARSNR